MNQNNDEIQKKGLSHLSKVLRLPTLAQRIIASSHQEASIAEKQIG